MKKKKDLQQRARAFLLAAGPIPGPEATRAGCDAARLCRLIRGQGLEIWTDLPLHGIFLEGHPKGSLPDWQIIADYCFGFANAEDYFAALLPYADTVHFFFCLDDPYQRGLLRYVRAGCESHDIVLTCHCYGSAAQKAITA